MLAAPAATLLTVLLLPALIGAARRVGLVDAPGGRKQHFGNVPLVGGIAIYAVLLAAIAFCEIEAVPAAIVFVGLAGLVVAIGVIDDACQLPAVAKLTMQVAVAVVAVACGAPSIGGAAAGLGGEALSVFVYVAMMNAINLLDGADGVAGGVSAASLAALIVLAASIGATGPGMPLVVLGGVLGFLVYNLPLPGRRRALVFLGDAGSTLIGFALAWFALELDRTAPLLPSAALAWIVALPVFDMGRVACGRMLRGASPFAAGRDHLHHLLLAHGMSPLQMVLAMSALAFALAATGIAGALAGLGDIALLAGLALAGLAYLGAVERLRRTVPQRSSEPGAVAPTARTERLRRAA